MPEKKSKYDTDPLDPDFVRHTDKVFGRTEEVGRGEETVPLPMRDPALEDQTRRFDEQISDTYPSVFIPPTYAPPPRPPQQPFTSFGAGPQQPPAQSAPPPPGPSSPYHAGEARPSSRNVEKLGIPENIATVLPYLPFWIGLVAAIIELLIVPRNETRTRFHASQGLALQLAIVAGSLAFNIVGEIAGGGLGGTLFWVASLVFLIISAMRVWQGKPHHIAPLEDATRWLNDHIQPDQQKSNQ